ncbi:D-glucuronyl C5-epimerase family protein [Paenibacillus humicus]|uniref:D-glucuronyl C5-epimerase family protein n=1 Tax=Paenibacillus humicus TaxID=412861 RepID=UPI003F1501A3
MRKMVKMHKYLIVINNEMNELEDSLLQIDNRVYLDIEYINRNFNADCTWDDEKKKLIINRKDMSDIPLREIEEYDYKSNYFNLDKIKVEKWSVKFDENGIPKNIFRWGEHYYPITIAHYALQHYSLFLKNQDDNSREIFLKVADYFSATQDEKGGWPSYFDHSFYKGRTEIIKAPWYSSMAQGQIFSVLSRAYYLTGINDYLKIAERGLDLFKVNVSDGGILRLFQDDIPWYEEYPTKPGSYVLNGFIFSLIGLHDLYEVTGNKEAYVFYKKGVSTLKKLISLFDLGNRTSYDLTHFTSEGAAPNIARWGYHMTHILCLKTLNFIEKDIFFENIINRWIGYSKGKFSKTN